MSVYTNKPAQYCLLDPTKIETELAWKPKNKFKVCCEQQFNIILNNMNLQDNPVKFIKSKNLAITMKMLSISKTYKPTFVKLAKGYNT